MQRNEIGRSGTHGRLNLILFGKIPHMRFSVIDEMALRAGIDPPDPKGSAHLSSNAHSGSWEGHCARRKRSYERLFQRGLDDGEIVERQLRELLISGTLFEEKGMIISAMHFARRA